MCEELGIYVSRLAYIVREKFNLLFDVHLSSMKI